MLAQSLLIAGALIFGVLGTIHLVYTVATPKFDPRDPTVRTAMQTTTPRLTREITMWRAWIGFNASHSLGAMIFAAFVLLLAIGYWDFLRNAPVFAWLAFGNAAAWFAVALRCWFGIPRLGIGIATACFLGAALSLTLG